MVRLSPERVLLIGDTRREVQDALLAVMPGAQITSVDSVFDGISELSSDGSYTTVIAAAEPIERRPEAAVRTLRDLAGDGRVILFGHATLELLSRKMLAHGCDDYLITPATPKDIQHVLGSPRVRPAGDVNGNGHTTNGHAHPSAAPATPPLSPMPLADALLDALLQTPHNSVAAAIAQINTLAAPEFELAFRTNADEPPPAPREGQQLLASPVRVNNEPGGTLYLLTAANEDPQINRHMLAQLAHLVGKVATLQDRHNRLQKLAITDELTGVYNARYFRHFLTRILERARKLHFPVTLLLFDIDDFKKYNDEFGHGVGDEILKQTAELMKRCTREHDLVARIGGDEFAVVFWDKEGPRQPRDPRPGQLHRPPQTPIQVFERFKALIASDQFTALGASGKGVLGISAGLAVYPYEGNDPASLIREADHALMQGAKRRSGKNSIYIVGTPDPVTPTDAAR